MFAMVLHSLRTPLVPTELADPDPGRGEIRVKVGACGVCRTDLHVVDGDLPDPTLPIIPGHEIVGRIDRIGPGVEGLSVGERVGIPWLGDTGPGQWADDAAIAPLLCAGLIGWRSLAMAGDAKALGLYGFGAAAHILAQVAQWQGRAVYAFTRPGDTATQAFARSLGAVWAGGSDEMPPRPLDAAIIFATVGALVPLALQAVRKGGRVVCAGIHMSDIPSFPYRSLWEERQLVSVANLTRQDGLDFLGQAPGMGIVTSTTSYPLLRANEALADLRAGRFEGAAVLLP